MRIAVTRTGGFAGMRRRGEIDTSGPDSAEWERLVRESRLDEAPPHEPAPDRFVYEIAVDDRTTRLAEQQLSAAQQELVRRVLEA